jgi:predicted nucleic acid-binding Zn ribbon protein
MKKRDRERMMIAYKIIAIFLAIALVLGLIFGAAELF